MALTWCDSGGTVRSRSSSAAIPGASAVNGAPLWLKWTLDVDNGASGHTVQFFYAADAATEPSSWTQLGTTITTAGVTDIAVNGQPLLMGQANLAYAANFRGSDFRTIIRSGIGGTTVLDVDTSVLTSMTATSLTARTGQPVSIVRSTGATYKTEVVLPGIGSRILNGTSDFGEIPDLPGLDFGASDSFTVWALVQQWGTPNNFGNFVTKRGSSGAGFFLNSNGTTLAPFAGIEGAGGSLTSATTTASASGSIRLISLARRVADDQIQAFTDGTGGTSVTDATTGSLENALPVTVGVRSASGAGTYQHFRLFAWGISSGALTSAQLTALRASLLAAAPLSSVRTLDVSTPARTLTVTTPARTLEVSA
jgi:hypothetical protein